MAVIFQHIAVKIELTVEIPGGEPVGLEQLPDTAETNGPQQHILELEIGQPVAFAGADVIESPPEFLRNVIAADIAQQTAGIFHRGPFQHRVHGHMEHDGLHIFQDIAVENAGLPQGHPVAQTRLGKDRLGLHLAQGIVVIDTDLDGIAGAAPVDGHFPVAGLRHGADVDHLHRIRIRLGLHRLHDIFRGGDVGLQGGGGIIVRRGGHHAAHMEHIARPGDQLLHIFVALQIAPDDLHRRVIRIFCKFLPVFLAVPEQQPDIEFFFMPVEFQEALEAHGA